MSPIVLDIGILDPQLVVLFGLRFKRCGLGGGGVSLGYSFENLKAHIIPSSVCFSLEM